MASYATPANMLARFDARTIGDLVADDGNQVSAADLLTNTILSEMLADASGEIESALIVGGRYSTTDLEGLTGNSLKLLIRLTCEVTFLNLITRRGEKYLKDYEDFAKLLQEKLERLRKGENTFNITANVEAGLVSISGPSTLDFQNLNLVRDRVGPSYYPARQLPFGR